MKKGRWEERWGGTVRSRGRGNHHENILREVRKKIYFQFKGKDHLVKNNSL